ncbi:MAG: hypothetical protein HY609_04885 [Deltaproteobacteria bacterium]|nr:hypothetical protein [Deltaproteobacteria bacterium]MBI4224247.1 hypothetical protein [Deltaproteobacteria bacterium]
MTNAGMGLWTTYISVPGGVDAALAQGLGVTPETFGDFSDAFGAELIRMEGRGADPEILETLADKAIALRDLVRGQGGTTNGAVPGVLKEISGKLWEAKNLNPIFALREKTRGVYLPRQIPMILNHIEDTGKIIEQEMGKLETALQKTLATAARLQHDLTAWSRSPGTSKRFSEVSPRALRRDLGETKARLEKLWEKKTDLTNAKADLLLLVDFIQTRSNGSIRPLLSRLLSNEALLELASRRVISLLFDEIQALYRAHVNDEEAVTDEEADVTSPSGDFLPGIVDELPSEGGRRMKPALSPDDFPGSPYSWSDDDLWRQELESP